MFYTKPRISENIEKRQHGRNFANVTATGKNVPLRNVDWSQRCCTIPIREENFEQIFEYEMRDDDICVVTFPKSGTTWVQEITWLLMHNFDFQRAKSKNLTERSPYLDFNALYTEVPFKTLDMAKDMKSPRILKSHLPAHLIPHQIWDKNVKIIYCARNPKDVAVSYYHFHSGLGTWQGEINEFVEDLINADLMFTPYWDHLMAFWQMRNEENVFFVTYEEMKRNLPEVIKRLNKFLQMPQLSQENLERLLDHLKFDNMKTNRSVDLSIDLKSFNLPLIKPDIELFRRGIVGSYKDELNLVLQNKLNKWIEENLKIYNVKLEDIFGHI